MCGISGIYSKNNDIENLLYSFNQSLNNRGPDNSSYFLSKKNYFGMSHTRLSILDLSDNGNQPMHDHSGDWVISFNGEIYNHFEIRDKISKKMNNIKIQWKGFSDTETILMANFTFGFEEMLKILDGMFAFALYNKKLNKLFIARDRLGEKPVYYYFKDGKFIFGSDLSIFKKVKNISLNINEEILPSYIEKGYIKAPYSIYKHIYKLEPGHFIELENNFSNIKKKKYWNIESIINSNTLNRSSIKKTFDDEKIELKKILEKTVIKQTISDVQIGCFLSGGIDSSLISSILQNNTKKKIKTFTVGFDDKNFDESNQAKKISQHLNTDHYEYFFSKNDLCDTVQNLSSIYSEPFADSSQLPTHLISKLMKKEAKVILSGDGGDELFGGYNRYIYLNKIKFFSKRIPTPIKEKLFLLLKFLPISFLNKYFSYLGVKNFEYKLNKFINFVNYKSLNELYNKMTTINSNPEFFLNENIVRNNLKIDDFKFPNLLTDEEKFMYLDQISYLPDDILCKVDRATMHNSIESRAPLLDHKLVEHSWKIPINYKIRNNEGKYILREILKDYLPKKLISTAKSGFGIPIDVLLRGNLKTWADDIINSTEKFDHIINNENLKNIWSQHKLKKINAGEKLWPTLILKDWLINQ